jgi:ubiquinone/menaquinone biosynthesis C-methylase UbiE
MQSSKPWYFREEIAEKYESFYTGKYRKVDLLEKEALLKAVRSIGNVKSILEVGCGTAHFTRWFESIGYEVCGLDISDIMLKQARKYWPRGCLTRGISYYLPFKDNTFDVVMFVACLEYMGNPESVIVEAQRVASKGLVLGLMNSWSIPTIRRKLQVLLGLNDFYKNARFYSIRSATALLKKSVKTRYSIMYVTTAFPFNILRFSKIPYGAFLCIALRTEKNEAWQSR